MKGNVWLAGYIVLSLVAIGGAGYFFFTNFTTFRSDMESWDNRSGTIARLQKEVPTPTVENAEQFQNEIAAYEAKVGSLFEALNRFQKPLNENLQQTEFPTILKQKVEDFKKLAADNNVAIPEPEDEFFLGFEEYKEVLPKQDITPLLGYQLEAIEHLSKLLVESGVDEILELKREALPGETLPSQSGTAQPPPGPAAGSTGSTVRKYPISFTFVAEHQAGRNFVNQIANDNEYFFILRVVRAENSAPSGPADSGEAIAEGEYVDGETGDDIPPEEVDKAFAGLDPSQILEKADELGWVPKRQDAVILFGKESVKAFVVIDLVRFLSPDEVKALEAESGGEAPETRNRRRP